MARLIIPAFMRTYQTDTEYWVFQCLTANDGVVYALPGTIATQKDGGVKLERYDGIKNISGFHSGNVKSLKSEVVYKKYLRLKIV